EDVPTSPRGAARAIERYLDQVLKVTRLRREHARRIAIPYYRLVRALWTGRTLQPLEVNNSGRVVETQAVETETLDDLREDFYSVIEILVPEALEDRPEASSQDGDDKIPVDEVEDLADSLNELEDTLDEITEDDLSLQAAKAGRRVTTVEEGGKTAVEFRDEMEDALLTEGAKLASKAQRSVRDGARRTSDVLAEKDPEAIGWIRVSLSGTPCGFCAMLIARGLQKKGQRLTIGTLYKSERAAERDAMGEKYHDNCQCRAVPVFSEEQILNDPAYELNRRYAKLWPRVTSGKSGKEALTAWRKYFRSRPSGMRGR